MDNGIKENNMVMDYLLKIKLLEEENGIWGRESDGLKRMKILKFFSNYLYKKYDYEKQRSFIKSI